MEKKQGGWLDQGLVFLFLVALMGYMPTARWLDRYVWVGALALLLLRTLWLLVKREVSLPMDVNLFIYMLVYTWGLVSCFWAKNVGDFLSYTTASFPVVLCAVVCLGTYIGQRMEPERFLQWMILAGVLAALRYCAYTDWSGERFVRGSFGGLLDDVTNYNNYTMVISTSCVLALYYAIVEHKRLYILPATLLMAVILLGGSRKNIVALPLIALLFTFFAGNGAKKLKILLILGALLGLGIYLLETVPELSVIRSAMEGMINGLGSGEEGEVDGSTEQRMYLMEQGIRVWAEHPVLGVGWNSYKYYNDARLYAHNNYVELLASLGSVGFLLYYLMFIRVGYIVGSAFLHRHVRKEDVLLLGLSFSVLIMEIGSITLYSKERLILMLLIFYWHSCATGRKTYRFVLK